MEGRQEGLEKLNSRADPTPTFHDAESGLTSGMAFKRWRPESCADLEELQQYLEKEASRAGTPVLIKEQTPVKLARRKEKEASKESANAEEKTAETPQTTKALSLVVNDDTVSEDSKDAGDIAPNNN